MLTYKSCFSLFIMAVVFSQTNAWSGRNQSLKDLPDRTWTQVCPYEGATSQNGGVSEVPWAFDANSKVFVRVGGCTGGYTNSIGFFDMGTETQSVPWTMDLGNPSNRPGGGCNRGLSYDPRSKCLFEMGGASSGPCYGTYGLWKGDMAARTWTQLDAETGQQGHVAVDTVNNRILIWYWDSGHWLHFYIWNPETNTKTICQARPGGPVKEDYWAVDWWPAMEYGGAIGGTMEVGYMGGWYTWLFNTQTRTWTDLNASGLESVAYGRAVLSYDPLSGVMLLLVQGSGSTVVLCAYNQGLNTWQKITTSTVPNGWSEMFDYDSEHNVHAFVGLTSSANGSVWAFRYANQGTALTPRMNGISITGPGLDCIPNPFQSNVDITYKLEQSSRINLSIYDVQGRLLRLLESGTRPRGTHFISWNAAKYLSTPAAGGVYILRLESAGERADRKLIQIR